MTLRKIRLEMARTAVFPDGTAKCGYDLIAPLDGSGKLDHEQWKHEKRACTVRRFWDGEGDRHGRLVHHRGGWSFAYPTDGEEEQVFRLDKHAFSIGEYVSVTEGDGRSYPFRIVSVVPALAVATA